MSDKNAPATANWSYPTAIRFGAGRIAEIADACAAAGISRPLLVTDKGLAGLPITQRTCDLMAAGGLGDALFADVDPAQMPEKILSRPFFSKPKLFQFLETEPLFLR